MKIDFKPILHFIIYDPIRKIIAIIFSFGLWFFVALDNNYQFERSIKVVYDNLGDSMIVVDSVPHINVLFNGRGGSLLSIWAAPPKIHCDLAELDPGRHSISTKDIDLPIAFSDIKYTQLTKSIDLHIDEKISKNISVDVPLKGSAKEGFSVSAIMVPDTIVAFGPKTLLDNISTLQSETLQIKNTSSSFMKKIRIHSTSPLVELSQQHIQVEVGVEKTVNRSFTNIPLRLVFTPSQRVSSEKVILDTLIIQGPHNLVNKITKQDIRVEIKLTKLKPGEYNLPAKIILPDFIKPVRSYPPRFRITVY